jgi:AcrR family transcriptional regulator
VTATRALFDERGAQDAPVEEIARAVGIQRGLIYRHFSSKEELYVLTVTDYLAELDGVLADALADGAATPAVRLERWARTYAGFCLRYPAFLDCALSLMHRPAQDLRAIVSESVWFRLGQGMAGCVEHVAQILRDGVQTGDFAIEEPDYLANVLWTQTLGIMHLARIRVAIHEPAPNIPQIVPIRPEAVIDSCVHAAIATATHAH